MKTINSWTKVLCPYFTNGLCIAQKPLAPLAKSVKLLVMMMVVGMVWGNGAWGATRYSVATGNWNSTSTWSDAIGGVSGFSVPVAGDVVYIENLYVVTVTADAQCTTLNFAETSPIGVPLGVSSGDLIVNNGVTLAVSGAIKLNPRNANLVACSISGAGTLSCASVTVGGTGATPVGSLTVILTSTIATFTISGSLSLIADYDGSSSNIIKPWFYLNEGSVTVNGTISPDTPSLSGLSLGFRMDQGNHTGTLNLGGSGPWATDVDISAPWGSGSVTYTVALNAIGTTVNYNAAVGQTINRVPNSGTMTISYYNLTLSGSGNKSLPTNAVANVNGTLSMQGTAAMTTKAPTFTSTSTLEYKGSSAQLTTNIEFPASSGPKNLIIDNTNGVTLHAARTISGTTTVNNGCTLATNATFTNSGTATINGTFQLNSGGWATGTAFVYGATSTLVFNSAAYGVNDDVYWPTSNSPYNVTALQTITMNVARSVSGTFQTSAGVTNANNLTFNGIVKLNTGGFLNTSAPTYGSSSTLIYNTGGTFGRGFEWNSTSGAGYPANIQISNNTTLNYPNGSNAAKSISGNLTIDAGSSLFMDYGSPAINNPLTIGGNLANYGSLSLGDAVGGDLKIYGNIIDNGNFYANNRAIFFNGGNTQVIQGTGVFDISYVRINKSAGSVQLATNLTCEGPNGNNAMEIDGTASVLDLNGFTLFLGKAGVASTYNSGIASPGVIKGSTSSNISILGTGALGTIRFDQTTPGTTNALNNLTINRTSTGTVTLGNALVVDGTLTLTEGALSGSLTYGINGILTYNGTSYSTTSDVEFPASSGPKDVNITVANGSGLSLHANRTVAGNLTIASGQKFIIPVLKGLTVNGALASSNNADLVIKSDITGTGSLITSSSPAATVERYLTNYSSGTDKMFHFISSPVAEQAIRTEFVTTPITAGHDFYKFDEVSYMWINSKANDGLWNVDFESTFTVGKGYMVAYPTAPVTKYFKGNLNAGDFTTGSNMPALTYTSGKGNGWNLLGNPYSSAIDWGTVTRGNGVDDALYYYNAAAQNYQYYIKVADDNITVGGGSQYIPAMQGFMVHAASTGTRTLTIHNTYRVHEAQTTYYKSGNTVPGSLSLTVSANGYQDEAFMYFNANATNNFDGQYDAYKLRSYSEMVPAIYTIAADGSELAINGMPELSENSTIPVSFVAGKDGEYTLTANLQNLPNAHVYLVDNKLSKTQNLSDNPVYTFTSATIDQSNRFKLTFGSVGIPEAEGLEPLRVYLDGSNLNIIGASMANEEIRITNMLGQVVLRGKTNGNTLTTLNANNLKNGVYVVSLIGNGKVSSGKFVK